MQLGLWRGMHQPSLASFENQSSSSYITEPKSWWRDINGVAFLLIHQRVINRIEPAMY
jgi:hypothetical protein